MEHKKSIRVRIDPWNRQKMVKYLENQAKKGWMFCGFEGKKWNFRLIEPKTVHFSVVYFPADFEKDETAVPRLLEFREFCAYDGWELAGADRELQILYSLKENPTPIETDPKLEVQTMQAAALRKHSPTLKRDVGMSIFYILFALFACHTAPVRFFLYSPVFAAMLLYGGGLLAEFLRVGEQFLWLFQAKRYVARHGEYPHHMKRIRISKLVGILTILAALEIMVRQLGLLAAIALLTFSFLVIHLIAVSLRWVDKQFFTSRVSTLVSIAMMIGILAGSSVLYRVSAKLLHFDQAPYAPLGSAWAKYEEVPPLDIDEYYGDGLEDIRHSSFVEETPFLGKYEVWMSADRGEDYLNLDYEIMEVKWGALYDLCMAEYMNLHGIGSRAAIDAEPWGAKEVYCRGADPGHSNLWLLCYEDRIVVFVVNEEPTPEQMALVGQRLG